MKSLVELQAVLLLDCGRIGGAAVDRDVKTLRSRVEHEGDSFLTITLPSFCKDFERCLAEGRVGPGKFLSFRKELSGIPSFLKGFLSKVFDAQGILRSDPSVDCIRVVRQFCLFNKKVLRTCSPERMKAAIEGFAKCDMELVSTPDTQMNRYYKRVATVMWTALLDGQDFRLDLVPVHGPGATQECISGNQKWHFRRWHSRLTDVGFTYVRFGRGSTYGSLPCKFHGREGWPELIEPEDEAAVRAVFVPKTQKAPRVIAVEPVVMQFAQQALSKWLVRRLESHRFTAGHVNFRDQVANQAAALDSSASGHLATVDMSEASDRVSLAHVHDMLESVPVFRDWVLACRSRRAQLPNGDIVTLKKFASMGSALCFPIESMVFYSIIVASRIRRAGRFPTARTVREFSNNVYVYGDDLLFPSDEAPAICADLESFGLKINKSKSFWTGKFRESCGADCYDGKLVTPVYLRRDIPADRTDANGLLSCVAAGNQLSQAGYSLASTFLRKKVELVLGPLPQVPLAHVRGCESLARGVAQGTPAIGWIDYSIVVPRVRRNRDLQRLESLCWVPNSPKRADSLSDYPALAKCYRTIGTTVQVDPEHLLRSVRPYGLTLTRRWVPLVFD